MGSSMPMTVIASVIILGSIGAILGAILAFASKVFAVEIDARIEEVSEVLPGVNCGACGAPGCMGFAERVVAGEFKPSDCTPGGEDTANKVGSILGVEVEATVPMRAVVLCKGGEGVAKKKYEYDGLEDCTAAELLSGGNKLCDDGCLGLGSCVKVCPFDAMEMGSDKLPIVYENLCTACGLCVEECPRDIMALIPKAQRIYVACLSKLKGKVIGEICKVSCNACGLCANPKTMPSGDIVMENNLPVINFTNNRNLVAATHRCARDCFVNDITYPPVQINAELCTGCPEEKKPECVKACPVKNCITKVEETGKYVINQETCIGCALCVPACPENAIPLDIEQNVSVEIQ